MTLLRVAGAVLLALLAGCSGAAAGPSTGGAPAALAAALLTENDVQPAGYKQLPPEVADRPSSSTRPECSTALDTLEIDTPSDPAVTEARAFFGAGYAERIQHIVREYPPGAAGPFLSAAAGTLAGCSGFELGYANGSRMQVMITPTPVPDIDGVVWTADIQAGSPAFTIAEGLVLLRSNDRIAVLSVTAPDTVDPALIRTLTATAATRLAA